MADVWPLIHVERSACAETVAGLTEEQLSTPSLCSQWTVRELVGHMIASGEKTQGSFVADFAKAGFRFPVMVGRDAKRLGVGGAASLSSRLAKGATTTNHPPGPVEAMLGEIVIHGEDMRRPLGIERQVPEAALIGVADFYKKSNLIVGAKKRMAGVRAKATDADWSNGDGPEVSGPLLSIIMAMTGRRSGLDQLSGEGLGILSQRF